MNRKNILKCRGKLYTKSVIGRENSLQQSEPLPIILQDSGFTRFS